MEVPIEWLEELHRQGRAVYLEQGLWIAAEQKEEYRAALEEGGRKEQCQIVRRMLR